MMNLSLNDLQGTWLTKNSDVVMWVSPDGKKVFVRFLNEVILKENIDFVYDSIENEYNLSKTIKIKQLFSDKIIRFQLNVEQGPLNLILYKRPY